MIKKLQNNKKDINRLALFFEKVNHLFVPELKDRISSKSTVISFKEYAMKVLKNASCLSYENEFEIVGIIVVYHNDMINNKAYIPILAVNSNYEGRGIATQLVLNTIELCEESNIKILFVNTWSSNKQAKRLYEKLGFEINEQNKNEIKFKLVLSE